MFGKNKVDSWAIHSENMEIYSDQVAESGHFSPLWSSIFPIIFPWSETLLIQSNFGISVN